MKYSTSKLISLPRSLSAIAPRAERLEKQAGDHAGTELSTAFHLIAQHRDSLDACRAMRANPDPSITPAANLARVRDTAKGRCDQFRKLAAQSRQDICNRIQGVSSEIANGLGVNMNNPEAPEIRAVFRSMTAQERGEAMDRAITNEDVAVIGAILRGGELLTGIPESMHNQYRERAARQLEPERVAAVAALEGAVAWLDSVVADMGGFVAELAAELPADHEERQHQADAARAQLSA